jgi:hypothetical protein
VIEPALLELERHLEEHGVHGRPARRFLAEAREHLRDAALAEDEASAVRRFGNLDLVARQVAAEVATTRVRGATFASFAALGATGFAYVGVFALVPAAGGWPDLFAGKVAALGPLSALAAALLPQIAFVSGCLALLAAVRLRRVEAAPGAELSLVRRRNAVALAAGAGTLLALAVSALNAQGLLAAWWIVLTVALSCALSIPVALAGVALVRSAAPEAAPGGRANDVFDDLAPVFGLPPVRRLELPDHPWRFAILCASAVFVLGLAGGWYAEGDPGSGLVRGGFEAIALLASFAVLGRTLGLRRTKERGRVGG